VTQGAYTQMTLMVSNALDSAPFESLYWTQPPQNVFSLLPNALPGPSLLPGDSQPMLRAIMNAVTAGTVETTFLVSPFAPGMPIDPSCGVIRTITMRAQIAPGGPPPLPPIPAP
jgi:hypothetical protein